MTGVAKNTISKLLVELGAKCQAYQSEVLVNLNCKRLQVDEIRAFVGAKQKNVRPHHFEDGGYAGDVWTWLAIDVDTKLVPCWVLGPRDTATGRDFIGDLAERLANRLQLNTDGLKVYLNAITEVIQGDIDYAILHKIYGRDMPDASRYSPAQCVGCEKKTAIGRPDPEHISTSYAERQNLTMRMHMRRFTRLTNSFSKKVENHMAAVALHFMYYNFAKVHQTLKTTPAVAAGIANHVWSVDDIVALLGESN
jgi:IS1 family transposase